ncbi:fasciclin-like arabinogalactan protein 12 [Actinidia eriantha]|uniref:fasciclin-like arabinogalactan protein 12 n=1 Tax=Actinidia eriantha TaxID=165200 RepID=UPI00258C8113|nr:fasciclin-like arabinogalactan protein 12 [Actinidia eriantha]
MFKHFLLLVPLLLIFSLHNPKCSAQSPAPSPAPEAAPHIVSILKKAGHFNTLIRLLKKTQMDRRIYSLLNNSNQLTIFAPTDEAFNKIPTETLRSFTIQKKIQLIQFHVINSLLSFSDFQTVSNPLSTQAGDNGNYKFPMNVTMSGSNQVNITTGVTNATVTGTIYSDDLLAVYQVDRVLLPMRFSVSPPPAPAPPLKPQEVVLEPSADDDKPSGAVPVIHRGLSTMSFVAISVIAAISLCV